MADATVTVTLGGHSVGTATSALAAGATEAAWSVTVPAAATYITGTSLTLSVTATRDGYAPAAPVTHTLTVDLAAPAVSYTAPASLTVGRAIAALTADQHGHGHCRRQRLCGNGRPAAGPGPRR